MAKNDYDQIDDLFAQVRLRLGKVRQSDPVIAEEMKGLLIQLEDWVESLVVDSLKLKSLESGPKGPKEPDKRLRKKQSGK